MTGIDRLKALAKAGKLSRREFMVGAMAAGVTISAASSMFSQIARAEPKQGGKLRIALGHGATTDSLDPATYPDQFTLLAMWGTLSNSLTEIDAKGNAVGDLAESFEPSDGAKTWVFRLRSGLQFHNGKSVTADDVVASIRHHMGADSKSAVKSLLEPVTDIKNDGGNVVFTLAAGSADFPFLVSDYHMPIMPSQDGKVDWQSGIRTGAFTLVRFEPGVRASFKRNPNYHKKVWFDEVEVLVIGDVAARTNALTSGEVDYIDRIDLKTVNLLGQNPDLQIFQQDGYGHYVFVMNVTQPPFDKVEVRTALKLSIDREDILKKVFQGFGKVGNDNPIPPSVKYAIDPQPRHTYDPEKAKALLEKAGLAGLKVDLSAADAAFSGCVDAAVLWKEHATKAGIDLNVIKEPNDGYWDNVWMKKPFVGSYWGGRPTCDWMFTTAYAADAAWNDTYWKHPRFNELLVAARSETDDAKRAAMYAEMQQLLHDDGGLVNLVFNSYVDAHSKKLAHNAEFAVNWPEDGGRIAERWWFA
jgi:peptide/nickel transport system substrate-binding protein